MPKEITAQSVEATLRRCRAQAAALDDYLLLYLIDMALLHLRRKPARPENNPTTLAIQGGWAKILN